MEETYALLIALLLSLAVYGQDRIHAIREIRHLRLERVSSHLSEVHAGSCQRISEKAKPAVLQ